MSSLNLYLASDPRMRLASRLIVARDSQQVAAMTPIGMSVNRATVFQAYRCGKLGLELEYARPQYEETT